MGRPKPFDIETTGLRPHNNKIVSMQIEDEWLEAAAPHPKWRLKRDLTSIVRPHHLDYLRKNEDTLIIHNALFEYNWLLEEYDIELMNFECTKLMAALTFTRAKIERTKSVRWSVALKPLIASLFSSDISEYDAFEATSINEIDPMTGSRYKGIAAITRHIYLGMDLYKSEYTTQVLYDMFKTYSVKDNVFAKRLHNYIVNLEVFQEIAAVYAYEKACIPVVSSIERRGFQMDRKEIQGAVANSTGLLTNARNELFGLTGEFDVQSDKAGAALVEAGVPLTEKNANGAFSVGKKVLDAFGDHEVVKAFRKVIGLQHDISNFYSAWLTAMDDKGVLRTFINMSGATHGRMASNGPNLMNIKKGPMRTFFRPVGGKDFTFVSFDYSQIELIYAAYYSGDKRLIKTLQDGADMHLDTATQAFNKPKEEITSKERKRAKICNFMIIYGGWTKALATYFMATLKIPYSEAYPFAAKYLKTFHSMYPGIQRANAKIKDILLTDKEMEEDHERFMDRRKAQGASTWALRHSRQYQYRGYIRHLDGRIWRPDAPNFCYKGFEALVSGSATGGLLKRTMVAVFDYLKHEKAQSYIALPIHDELLMAIHKDEWDLVGPIKRIMEAQESKVSAKIPIKVEIEKYENGVWGYDDIATKVEVGP